MDPVQITPEASRDIAKLAQGVDRAQVVLEALRESNLSPSQIKELEALLKKVSPTKGAFFATKSEAVAEWTENYGYLGVVDKITVNCQQLDTLLSEGSFNKTRAEQIKYAKKLGYTLATREEHLAYVEGLLAKDYGTINDPEKYVLSLYRGRLFIRDIDGGLDIDGRRVDETFYSGFGAYPDHGALFVRASTDGAASAKFRIDDGDRAGIGKITVNRDTLLSDGSFQIRKVDGRQAVVGKITVNGQQLDTLLSQGFFKKTRADLIAYAESIGYTLATREENRAYVEGLLPKEGNGTINDPDSYDYSTEKYILERYKYCAVMDTDGGLDFDGRRVRAFNRRKLHGKGRRDALFVRASADGAASATKSEAVAEFNIVDGYRAVVDKITVNGLQLDTLLSEGSLKKTRRYQIAYAESLGYTLATREENRAYVEGLLAKEVNGTINDPEKYVLEDYKGLFVRDTHGGVGVCGRGVDAFSFWDDDRDFDPYCHRPAGGALFVRASAESELTREQIEQREALLKKVSPTDGAASATKSEAVAEFKIVDGHRAVVDKITVNGLQLDTLLSEGSFNKIRHIHHSYAKSLGYTLATRKEHLAYVEGLLAKEGNGTINDPEKEVLENYRRRRFVRDTDGGLGVDGRCVRDCVIWPDLEGFNGGALFVRASADINY